MILEAEEVFPLLPLKLYLREQTEEVALLGIGRWLFFVLEEALVVEALLQETEEAPVAGDSWADFQAGVVQEVEAWLSDLPASPMPPS